MVWLPQWLAFRINPIPFLVEKFLATSAKEIPAGSMVLDAGAGECRYAPLFSHCRYLSIDFAKGDPKWNYHRFRGMNLLKNNLGISGLTVHRSKHIIADPTGSSWNCLPLFDEHHFVSPPWTRREGWMACYSSTLVNVLQNTMGFYLRRLTIKDPRG